MWKQTIGSETNVVMIESFEARSSSRDGTCAEQMHNKCDSRESGDSRGNEHLNCFRDGYG